MKKNKTVTVYTQSGMGLTIFEEVAQRQGVRDGQKLSDQKLAEVGAENYREGIARCELEIAINEFNENNK